ncbi:MAG: aromatic ring-hydroxylating dioxygenase subunit alpha, partial [Brasilonema sp.]
VDHIPPTARQATYVTAERYGYIWVWYGSQTPLFPLPEFSAAEDERHNYMSTRSVITANTTLRTVIENIFDFSHLVSIHNAKTPKFFDSFQITLLNEQHSVQQNELPIQKDAWLGVLYEFPPFKREDKIGALSKLLVNGEVVTLRVDAWPSGIIFTHFLNGEESCKELFCLTPVAENKTNLVRLFMVKKTGKFWLDIPYRAFFSWRTETGYAQDLQMWNHMKPNAGGVYVKHDWLVLKFRKFYQSWVDKVE